MSGGEHWFHRPTYKKNTSVGRTMLHITNIKNYIRAIAMLLVSVFTTACVKEYSEGCDNTTIYFQYLADGDEDVLYKYISKVDLYVFDEDENILGHGVYTKKQLENFAAIPTFRLKPGKKYKVVALGNAYNHTDVVNLKAGDFDNIFIQDVHWDDEEDVTTHDHNYLGVHEFTMPDREGQMYRDTVTLYSSHIDVEVTLSGERLKHPLSRSDLPYSIRIENSNPQTSFHNRINTQIKGTCNPLLEYDPKNKRYSTKELVLFRMDGEKELKKETCSHEIVVTDKETGTETRFSIYDYLRENPQAMKDALLQEAILPMEINFSDSGINIKIPDWEIEDTEPDWEM